MVALITDRTCVIDFIMRIELLTLELCFLNVVFYVELVGSLVEDEEMCIINILSRRSPQVSCETSTNFNTGGQHFLPHGRNTQ